MSLEIKSNLQYEIRCHIDDINMTNDLMEVEIIKNLNAPYATYILRFNTDTDTRKFFDDINPEMNIKLQINTFLESQSITKTIGIDLVYITDDAQMPSKYDKYQEASDNQVVWSYLVIMAIPKIPLLSVINPIVNTIQFGKTPKEILELVCDHPIIFETEPENSNKIYQYVTEKQSFIRELKKLNYYYGLYKGPLFRYMDEFALSWRIGNLTKMLNKKEYITLEQITISNSTKEVDLHSFENLGKHYHLTGDIMLEESASTFVGVKNYTLRVVNYPKDNLYYEENLKLEEDLLEKYSPIDKSNSLRINSILKNKYKNWFDMVGFEYDTTYFISNQTEETKSLTKLLFSIHKFVDIETFYPGRICMFKTGHQRYVQFMGKYVLSQTNLKFTRSESAAWMVECKGELIRSNLKY